MINPLKKNVIIPEPVMILIGNLDQWLNLTRETKNRQKIDDNFISVNCDVNVISPIYGQFRAMQKPDSGRIVCKTYTLTNTRILSCKN